MKANFPPVLGKFFHSMLIDVLKGTEQPEIANKSNEKTNIRR